MANFSSTWSGNSASRGNLTFQIKETITGTKAYQNGIEGYNVLVQRYLWCSMTTGGIAVSGSVCNGATNVNAGNNGTTNIINQWYKAGTTVSVGSCSVTVRMNKINATSSLGAQSYTLPAPTFAVLESATFSKITKGTNNTFTLTWTPNTSTQTFEYGIKNGDAVLVSDTIAPASTAKQTQTLTYSNDTLAELMRNIRSVNLTAYVQTVGVGVSAKNITMTIDADSGYAPTISDIACHSSNTGNPYGNTAYYNGYSKAVVDGASVTYEGGATFSSATVKVSKNNYLSRALSEAEVINGFNIGQFNTSGEESFSVTVTDSRGFSVTTNAINITISDYLPIGVTGFFADRCDEDGAENIYGVYAHPHGAIVNKVAGSRIGYTARCTRVDDTSESYEGSGTLTLSNGFELSPMAALILGSGNLSLEYDYIYTLTLTDGISTAFTGTYRVQGSYSILEVHHSKKGIAFLGADAENNKFKIGDDVSGTVDVVINGEPLPSASSIVNTVVNTIYPVGSIYMSVNDVNPSTLFQGTQWEQIEDKFLLSAGATHVAGETGGKEKVRLRAAMGAVNNNANAIGYKQYGPTPFQASNDPTYIIQGTRITTFNNWNHSTPVTEADVNSEDTSIMPPYLAVYMWKRTA